MQNYISFDNVNCKDCYKCLRACPVKSMKFTNHQAEILEDECILCGNCYLTCPQKAKEIRNDTQRVKKLLHESNDVYAAIAPSFIANYKDVSFNSIKNALMELGFKDVYETAIGAEIVTKEYEKIVDEKKQNIIISSCCQTVNLLIRKYYPDAVKYMASVISPMTAIARRIKEEHPHGKVVFIGPCLSKKEEVDENINDLSYALTFIELTKWLNDENIQFLKLEEKAEKYNARLYPIASGILKTMKKNKDYSYIAIDGLDNCKNALEEILDGKLNNCFIEMSSCTNSCVGGPGMDKKEANFITSFIDVTNFSGDKTYDVKLEDTNKNYEPIPVISKEIDEKIIISLLQKIGKNKPSDELNCGSCGYNTCREKAKAMYYGKTEASMCLPYLKNKALSYMDDIVANTPNGIIILNDSLEIELINTSACLIINVDTPKDVIGYPIERILDPSLYTEVLKTKKKVVGDISYVTEYGKYIEQNVIYDSKYKIVMIILRDITETINEQKRKELVSRNTIEVTDKIIEKQMRAVQEIASLLGESTAETKVALEKLKDVLK